MNYEAIGLIMSFVSVPLLLVGLVMLVIQAIRKKKKKSSLIVMLLSVLLFVGGFGVSLIGDPDLFPKDKAEEAKEYAETLVIGEFNPLTHENVKLVSVNFTNEDVDGNKYTFQGKVTVTDNYSDQYKGRFTVVLTKFLCKIKARRVVVSLRCSDRLPSVHHRTSAQTLFQGTQ